MTTMNNTRNATIIAATAIALTLGFSSGASADHDPVRCEAYEMLADCSQSECQARCDKRGLGVESTCYDRCDDHRVADLTRASNRFECPFPDVCDVQPYIDSIKNARVRATASLVMCPIRPNPDECVRTTIKRYQNKIARLCRTAERENCSEDIQDAVCGGYLPTAP